VENDGAKRLLLFRELMDLAFQEEEEEEEEASSLLLSAMAASAASVVHLQNMAA